MLKKVALIILSAILFSPTANADGVGFFGWTDIYYESPVWSRDGSRIYFIKNVEHSGPSFALAGSSEVVRKLECYIMSMRPDGSDKKVITKFISKKYSLEYIHNLVILSGDNQLAFFLSVWHGKENGGIYKINIDGTNLVKLAGFGDVTKIPSLFVSLDEAKIAYTKERYKGGAKYRSYFSSWVVDVVEQSNYMICGEDSRIIGWTNDGKLVISALTDLEGNVKPEYDSEGNEISYGDNVRRHILVYDFLSKKFEVKTSRSFDEILKNLGIQEKDASISPDGKKKIFFIKDLIIMDIDGKNEKILLKGKKR